MRLLLYILLFSFIGCSNPNGGDDLSDPHDWHYNAGSYQYTSWIVGCIVQNNGENIAEEGDLFAAFDEVGNVRGVAVNVFGIGPYAGVPMYEMTIGSNIDGDAISFQYYDASADTVLGIVETYTFETNKQQGNLISPVFYNIVQISTK